MTAKEILKLIDAGFTKDEIFKLDADVKVVPDPKPADDQKTDPEPTKPDPEPAQAPTAPAAVPQSLSGVTLSDDQFKKLLQQLNVQGASLDVPPEADMSQKLAEHFKEITIGG